ncbi:hypothetical protein PInf_006086 [Phytophthora infestans]|nr:hypothetical protein PInf_006086 [Phytophthora infestans]
MSKWSEHAVVTFVFESVIYVNCGNASGTEVDGDSAIGVEIAADETVAASLIDTSIMLSASTVEQMFDSSSESDIEEITPRSMRQWLLAGAHAAKTASLPLTTLRVQAKKVWGAEDDDRAVVGASDRLVSYLEDESVGSDGRDERENRGEEAATRREYPSKANDSEEEQAGMNAAFMQALGGHLALDVEAIRVMQWKWQISEINSARYILGTSKSLLSVPQINKHGNLQVVFDVHWRKTIRADLVSMRLRDVFRAAKLSNGQRAVGTKWVFKIKRKADGSMTLSSVIKYVMLCMVIALAKYFGWPLNLLDVVTAFLYVIMKDLVFNKVLEGVELDGDFDCLELILAATNNTGPELTIREDNQLCIKMTKYPVNHGRAKHINIKYSTSMAKSSYRETSAILVDIVAKAVPGPRHLDLTATLSIKAYPH